DQSRDCLASPRSLRFCFAQKPFIQANSRSHASQHARDDIRMSNHVQVVSGTLALLLAPGMSGTRARKWRMPLQRALRVATPQATHRDAFRHASAAAAVQCRFASRETPTASAFGANGVQCWWNTLPATDNLRTTNTVNAG